MLKNISKKKCEAPCNICEEIAEDHLIFSGTKECFSHRNSTLNIKMKISAIFTLTRLVNKPTLIFKALGLVIANVADAAISDRLNQAYYHE